MLPTTWLAQKVLSGEPEFNKNDKKRALKVHRHPPRGPAHYISVTNFRTLPVGTTMCTADRCSHNSILIKLPKYCWTSKTYDLQIFCCFHTGFALSALNFFAGKTFWPRGQAKFVLSQTMWFSFSFVHEDFQKWFSKWEPFHWAFSILQWEENELH